MDKYYVIVTGTGSTSRANVEALIDDYVYANGQDVTFILVYETQPAPGQVFISQWAKDKNKDILVFANEGAKFDGIYSASVIETNTPLLDACKFAGKVKTAGFVLWDKENPDNDLLSTLLNYGITPADLSEGLNTLAPKGEVEEPAIEPEKTDIDVDAIVRRVTEVVMAELNASKTASKGSTA
jgi:hypothetical protein